MQGLLIKDLKLLKMQFRFLIMILGISCFMLATGAKVYFVTAYMTLLFATFTLNSISYDEFENGMPYLFTMPVTRGQYVREKYLFSALCALCSWGFTLILTTVFSSLRKDAPLDIGEYLFVSLAYLIGTFLFLSLAIPVKLKFGSEKAQTVLFGIIGVSVFGGVLAAKYVKTFPIDLTPLIAWIKAASASTLALGLLTLGILALAASCCISGRIMEQKEF